MQILKSTKLKNYNCLVVGHININGLKNKFESLQMLINGNIDIIVIIETKFDESFPSLQFAIEGYAPPFRLDRNINGGGVIIYVREDIPCRELKTHGVEKSVEGIFLEINLRKSKWLLFGGYNYNKGNIDTFIIRVISILL